VKTQFALFIVLTAFAANYSMAQTPPAATPAPAPGQVLTADGGVVEDKSNPLANAVSARTPEAQAAQSGVQVAVNLDQYIGTGTFLNQTSSVDGKRSANSDYIATNLGIGLSYLFSVAGRKLVFSGSTSVTYEHTTADAATGRRWSPTNVRLGLSAPATLKGILKIGDYKGISLTPSLSASVPATPESFNAGLISVVGLSVALSSSVGPLDFRLSGGIRYGIFTRQYGGQRAGSVDAQGVNLVLGRKGEVISDPTANNVQWGANVGGLVQWAITGNLQAYAQYGYNYSRPFAISVTEGISSQGVDANGNPVVRSDAPRDGTSGVVGLSYQFNDHYSFDIGASTSQLPFGGVNGDTKARYVNFPFWSVNPANGATSIYFSLAGAY
jgi:hypothetical protein